MVRHAATLTLALLGSACTRGGSQAKPLEVQTLKLERCGSVAEFVERGGRIYGVTNGEPGFVCAFDAPFSLNSIEHEQLPPAADASPGVAAQLVRPDGTQLIAASSHVEGDNSLHVALLRRGARGVEQLDEYVTREAAINPGSVVVRDLGGEQPLVLFSAHVHNPSCGNSYDSEVPVTQWILDAPQRAESTESGMPRTYRWVARGNLSDALVDTHRLVTASTRQAIFLDDPGAPVARDSTKSRGATKISITGINPSHLAGGERAQTSIKPSWETLLDIPSSCTPLYRHRISLDIAEVGEQIFVLLPCDTGSQLHALAATDGARIASAVLAEADYGALRAGSSGVEVALLARNDSGQTELSRLRVGVDGQIWATRTRELSIAKDAWVETLELGAEGRVWLGGRIYDGGEHIGDTAWLGVVNFPS